MATRARTRARRTWAGTRARAWTKAARSSAGTTAAATGSTAWSRCGCCANAFIFTKRIDQIAGKIDIKLILIGISRTNEIADILI